MTKRKLAELYKELGGDQYPSAMPYRLVNSDGRVYWQLGTTTPLTRSPDREFLLPTEQEWRKLMESLWAIFKKGKGVCSWHLFDEYAIRFHFDDTLRGKYFPPSENAIVAYAAACRWLKEQQKQTETKRNVGEEPPTHIFRVNIEGGTIYSTTTNSSEGSMTIKYKLKGDKEMRTATFYPEEKKSAEPTFKYKPSKFKVEDLVVFQDPDESEHTDVGIVVNATEREGRISCKWTDGSTCRPYVACLTHLDEAIAKLKEQA